MANLFDTLLKSWNEQDVQTYHRNIGSAQGF